MGWRIVLVYYTLLLSSSNAGGLRPKIIAIIPET